METPSFYKILMDLPSKLALPRGFTEKYPETLQRKAKLRIASGATWEVRVEKSGNGDHEQEEDCYFFTKGWSKFLRDMKLKRLELLVFSYAGDSSFYVTVYATTANEKDSNFLVSNNPRFQLLMEEHHHYRMVVGEEFYEAAGLAREETVVVEYRGGESVEVEVNIYRNGGRSLMIFGKGWKNFWGKNRMGVGKAYSFEFLPTKKMIQVKPIASLLS